MTETVVMPLVYSILVLVLVGSGLIAYRQPMGTVLKHGLVWLAIFAGAFLLVTWLYPMFQ